MSPVSSSTRGAIRSAAGYGYSTSIRATRGARATCTSKISDRTAPAATRYLNGASMESNASVNVPGAPEAISVGVQSAGSAPALTSARNSCATTGAELPASVASIVSGEPEGRRTLPGVTWRATRDGNSRSANASPASRIVPRPANDDRRNEQQRERGL